jgi:hypothetical protein
MPVPPPPPPPPPLPPIAPVRLPESSIGERVALRKRNGRNGEGK